MKALADDRNDPFWTSLAEAAQENIEEDDLQSLDPRWSAYVAGELSPAEAEELLEGSEQSREGRLAAALFKPLGDDLAGSIVEQIQSRRASDSEKDPAHGDAATLRSSLEREPSSADAVDRRSSTGDTDTATPWSHRWIRHFFSLQDGFSVQHRGFRMALGSVAALTLVVGLFFLVGRSPLSTEVNPPLPTFELSVRASPDLRSGESVGTEPFGADGRLELMLRPSTTVSGPSVLSVFVRDREGELRRWSAAEMAAQRRDGGAFVVRSLEWPWGPGDFELFFIVGRDSLKALKVNRGQAVEEAIGPDFRVAQHTLRVEPVGPAMP